MALHLPRMSQGLRYRLHRLTGGGPPFPVMIPMSLGTWGSVCRDACPASAESGAA